MEIINSDDMPVRMMAEIALGEHLYHSPAWTMISCYRDILAEPDIEETSSMLLLRDENKNYIGASFFNNEFCDQNYWGCNIQMYVHPNHRGNGYAKLLFTEMNNFLKKKEWNGIIYCGCGIQGSIDFWNQMNKLHVDEPEKYFQVCLNY